jgi:hypothetical protein
VPSDLALYNTQLPALTKHTLSAGTHFQMNDWVGLSLAYVHGFKNSITGAVFPLLGTSTTIDTEYDSIVFSLHIKFGGPRCKDVCVSQAVPTCCGMPGEAGTHPVSLPGDR